ncbi:50S ribosomal protein L5 [Candidatus Micrarchaeota archaeon]|nr:50S ribosomal protein L5 [Candidatus Micrarchaeota archaeon]
MNDNKMKEISIEKITVNIGVGEAGQKLENARILLERLTNRKVVTTKAKIRNPVFKIKKGDPIGAKVTLRKQDAREFLKKALDAVDSKISERYFDKLGNFSFGVPEYIDFPGAKYDPKIGIIGFDVCVTLKRKGFRIKKRRRAKAKVGKKHLLSRDEAIQFVKNNFKIELS